ncbi:MAG: isoprenylcysteine carboxylmethyltransferase family protein [Archangium sp.]
MSRNLLVPLISGAFFVGALLVRPALHRLRTGSWGFNGFTTDATSAGKAGARLFALSLGLFPIALVIDSSGPLSDLAPFICIAGAAFTLFAQSNMGRSWRIGVRTDETTALVTTGLYRWVRNPIFTGMITFAIGLALWWPNWVLFLALVSLVAGVELQVRFVEEPHLRRVHGVAWLSWARRTGRFVPKIGTLW